MAWNLICLGLKRFSDSLVNPILAQCLAWCLRLVLMRWYWRVANQQNQPTRHDILVERYLCGGCHLFALAAHSVFDDASDIEYCIDTCELDGGNGLSHMYVVFRNSDRVVLDLRGLSGWFDMWCSLYKAARHGLPDRPLNLEDLQWGKVDRLTILELMKEGKLAAPVLLEMPLLRLLIKASFVRSFDMC